MQINTKRTGEVIVKLTKAERDAIKRVHLLTMQIGAIEPRLDAAAGNIGHGIVEILGAIGADQSATEAGA